MTWTREDLLHDLGLARRGAGRGRPIRIDKGEVDAESRGAIAMISRADKDLGSLDLHYWAIWPSGRMEKQNLFQMETRERADGRLDITGLWVLGREVNLRDTPGVNNVLEAIRQVHVHLRGPSAGVPPVARIFADCRLEEIIGESLPLPGFDRDKRLRFPISPVFNDAAGREPPPKITLPYEAVRPLLGMRTNTLDRERSYAPGAGLKARGAIPQVGRRFEIASRVVKTGNETTLTLGRRAIDEGPEEARPEAAAQWKRIRAANDDGDDMAEITLLETFNRNMLRQGRAQAMNAIGVVGRNHADMLEGDYPRTLDHLAAYGLQGLADSSANPPPPEGRFVLTSAGGNNLREIYPGVGEDIGGNCKIVETQWRDEKTGEVRKLGMIADFGAYLIKGKSDFTGAVPDIVDALEYCKDICITHHHLDHIDGLLPYVRRGLVTAGHTVHMTREVHEMMRLKFSKSDIPRHKWPSFHLLDGTGVIDREDENGVVRMSAIYGADAVPHSARCTPFTFYGRCGDDILGSYTYLGDMRYDDDWFDIYDAEFWNPVKIMSEREPRLDPGHLKPTYAEIDLTSVKREGRAPREREVEDNLTRILTEWFPDRHAGMAMIGTADGRRETLLRVGNRARRKMTAFGAAVQDIYRIANKHGVNPYLCPRPLEGTYTGIGDYLKWHAQREGLEKPVEFRQRTSAAVADWFLNDPPGSVMAVLSGSQGNPIEVESMTYRLAEGRSYFDANPGDSRTARPADLRDWVIVFTQSAIPGNGKYQRELIRKLAGRGAVVVEAYGDNLRVHKPDGLAGRIVENLRARGNDYEIEGDGSILVPGMPIHASGHGRREDFRLWLGRIDARIYGGHHTDDPESVHIAYETILREGKRHPGAIFQNYEQVQITTDDARVIGRVQPSIVLTREEMEDGKHYNKRYLATRFVTADDRSPHYDMGLRGLDNGPYETHFGMEDAEDARRRAARAGDAKVPDTRSPRAHAKPLRAAAGAVRLKAPAWDPALLHGGPA